jgi:hypothetical protein
MPVPSESRMQAAVDWKKKSDEWVGWKHIVPITKENLKRGNGPIEFLPQNILHGGDKEPVKNGPIFTFGKYKGKSYEEVKRDDWSYWSWAVEKGIVKREHDKTTMGI